MLLCFEYTKKNAAKFANLCKIATDYVIRIGLTVDVNY